MLSLGETYGEITPSSEDLRLFVFGSIDAPIKDDQVGVEIYDRSRLLTITGNQVEGTPSEIREAPPKRWRY